MYRFDGPQQNWKIEGNHSLYNMKKKLFYLNSNFRKYHVFKQFFTVLNLNISFVPVCASMKFLSGVDNIQMEGMISQIFYIGPSLYFMIKNGKIFVIVF